MIGIPILDSLSTWELCLVSWGDMYIKIPDYQQIQTSIDDNPTQQIREIPQSKIITLCKMEIESRLGFQHLGQLLEGLK